MTHVAIGSKDYIQQRALIPTPEELAKLAEAIRCAMDEAESARIMHREARGHLAFTERRLKEANEQLSHARAMLRIRAEGYDVVPVEQAPKASAGLVIRRWGQDSA